MEDETMSQDTAFETSHPEDVFKFDDDDASSASPVGTEDKEQEDDNESAEPVGTEEDEQKVPYSRFNRQRLELEDTRSKMNFLEERLQELENRRNEPTTTDDIDLPSEWVQLYGDSDVAKQAYKVQLRREDQIAERAVRQALESIDRKQYEDQERIVENESIIDDNLDNLSESIGKKLTSKQEEDILSIVDEFSPVGDDGKYVALFPFDKAYEIYNMRNSIKGQATKKARTAVSDLTSSATESDIDSTGSDFKRGWDNWRSSL